MNSLWKRIKKRLKMIIVNFKSDCHISYKLAFLRVVDDVTSRLGMKKVSAFFHNKKDNFISKFLESELSELISVYKDDTYCGEYTANSPIWVCWWTGEETAPALVKKCIESIRKNAGQHPVNFITQDNYSDYLQIPSYILEKLEKKIIGIANFSDYLRFSLLEKYGGIWLDATIYVSSTIPEDVFTHSLYTCRSPEIECGYISRYRWTSFCFSGWKNHVLFRFFKSVFEKYWLDFDVAIDYLFVDYVIDLAVKNIEAVKLALEDVPFNNLSRDDLQEAMNNALPAESFSDIIKPDTVLYKLSWRETYSLKTIDGNSSVYEYYLNMKL